MWHLRDTPANWGTRRDVPLGTQRCGLTYSTEEDESFYAEFPAATVTVVLLFSRLTRLHHAPYCRMQHRHALVHINMIVLTVMQKVLNNDRHPTCTRTHTVESENCNSSLFFCLHVLPVSPAVANL